MTSINHVLGIFQSKEIILLTLFFYLRGHSGLDAQKRLFCTFFKVFIIIDFDIKFVGFNKYTIEIHKKILYSFQTRFIRKNDRQA